MMTPRRKYSIYVIELGAAACDDSAYDHARRDPGKPCLYVGSTGKSIGERYADQTGGAWTQARAVKKHGARQLRMDLAASKYAYSRGKAEEIEARLGDALRALGYGVSQH